MTVVAMRFQCRSDTRSQYIALLVVACLPVRILINRWASMFYDWQPSYE